MTTAKKLGTTFLFIGILVFSQPQGLSAEEQVDLLELMRSLQQATNLKEPIDEFARSSKSWEALNQDSQGEIVKLLIELFKIRENSAILLPPSFYVDRINEQLQIQPTMIEFPLPIVLKVLAVMEYDFYNGQNKEKLAKQVLGDELYEQNKQRRALLGYVQ